MKDGELMGMPNKFNDYGMYLWDQAEKEVREEKRKERERKKQEEARSSEKEPVEVSYTRREPPEIPDNRFIGLNRAEFTAAGFEPVKAIQSLTEGDYVQVLGYGFGVVSSINNDATIEIHFGRDIYRWFSLSLLIKENRIYLYI